MKRLWPAILLAWIAGFVDALGYLALAKVFTAHMSGNAAAVGAELGSGNWHEAMIRGLVIPGFVLGIAVGAMMEQLSRGLHLRPKLAPAFCLETVLLLCFLAAEPVLPGRLKPTPGTLRYFLRVWLLAAAMGIQSATLRRAGGVRVRTTYISGMLTNMTENAVHFLLRFWKIRRPEPGRGSAKPARWFGARAAVFGFVFVSFLAGGICGGFGEVRWGSIALAVPMAGLVLLAVDDWVSPIRQDAPPTR